MKCQFISTVAVKKESKRKFCRIEKQNLNKDANSKETNNNDFCFPFPEVNYLFPIGVIVVYFFYLFFSHVFIVFDYKIINAIARDDVHVI